MTNDNDATHRRLDKRNPGVCVTIDDRIIGRNIRHYRKKADLSQQQLVSQVDGLTYQQLLECETGKLRISAIGLYHISRAIKTPMDYFFDKIIIQEGGVAYATDLTYDDLDFMRFLKLPGNELVYSGMQDYVRHLQAGRFN